MMMINLPGIGNSGEPHWQTRWERSGLPLQRFQPASWDAPVLDDWVAALERCVAACPQPPLLIAHSLSCLLVAHWAARTARPVRGALLVAVPDPASAAFPVAAASFAAAPDLALAFPALIVASANDPYSSLPYAQERARRWQAGIVDVGASGHLNGESGLGDWDQGRALLAAFLAGMGGHAGRRA